MGDARASARPQMLSAHGVPVPPPLPAPAGSLPPLPPGRLAHSTEQGPAQGPGLVPGDIPTSAIEAYRRVGALPALHALSHLVGVDFEAQAATLACFGASPQAWRVCHPGKLHAQTH